MTTAAAAVIWSDAYAFYSENIQSRDDYAIRIYKKLR